MERPLEQVATESGCRVWSNGAQTFIARKGRSKPTVCISEDRSIMRADVRFHLCTQMTRKDAIKALGLEAA